LQKVTYTVIIFILLAGCSTIKFGVKNSSIPDNVIVTGSILQRVEKQNITRESFFIQKLEISLDAIDEDRKFFGSVKFVSPDKYLISLRSIAGIEVARIFMSDDTVLVNDRINRTLYYGSSHDFEKKYGITSDIIPIILGDYVSSKREEDANEQCIDGMLSVNRRMKGVIVKYLIDCKKAKAIQTFTENSNGDRIEIKYNEFILINGFFFAEIINIEDIKRDIKMVLKVKKVDFDFDGPIEFFPGSKYKMVPII